MYKNTIPDPIFYKDENLKYMKFNDVFKKYLGKTREELYGKTVYEISPKELADIYNEKDLELINIDKTPKYESLVKNSIGELRNIIFTKAVCFIDGKKKCIVGTIQDVTNLRKLEIELKEFTLRDSLTSLYYRSGLQDLGLSLFRYAIRKQVNVAVFMMDINNFKSYNDTYVHVQGYLCLKQIGKVINTSCNRSMDFARKYGGEEFIVILIDVDKSGALNMAEKIGTNIRALNLEHSGNLKEKIITVSIGVYLDIPKNTDDFDKFIQNADEKLYSAKSNRKGIVVI